MRANLPNYLTYSRIAVIPVLMVVFYMPQPWSSWLSWGLFTYAGITDYFDGYIARLWKVQSPIGKFLDPIADKLLVAASLVLLVSENRANILPVIIILCRELLVSGLREFMADKQISVPVSFLAKVKTTAQLFAIGGLLVAPGTPPTWHLYFLSTLLFWISAGLTAWTGYQYMRAAFKSW